MICVIFVKKYMPFKQAEDFGGKINIKQYLNLESVKT